MKMRSAHVRASLLNLCAGASGLCLATAALAQEAPTNNVSTAPNDASAEIIVTATRQAQSLQDVPMSVDVATGEQIQKLNIFDAKDIQQLSPGLELTNSVGRNNNATLRGIQSDPDAGAGATVDFYFNEVPVDIQTAFTAIYDIDQIEVLRGPQGALRGRTAPAGAITLRTRRPDLNDINGYVQATASLEHAYNVQGGVSLPLVPGKLAMRVAALVDGSRLNQVYNFNRDEWSRSRTESGRLSFAWLPTEDLRVNLTYQYLHADNRQNQQVISTGTPADLPNGATTNGPVLDLDDLGAVSEGRKRFMNRTHLLTLNAEWNLGAVTLSAVGGLQRTRLNSINDLDPANLFPNYSNEQVLQVTYPVEMGELRLSSNNDGFFNWSIGGYYYNQGGSAVLTQDQDLFILRNPFPIPGLPAEVQYRGELDLTIPIKTRTLAIAGSTRLQITDQLRLEVAARYSDIKGNQRRIGSIVFPENFINPAQSGLVLPITAENPTHEKPLTGAANLTYEISPDMTAYAAFGRSFRGGTNAVSGSSFVSRDLLQTESEKSDSYEVGLKTSFLDRRMSLNIAAFRQKYKNFVTRIYGVLTNEGDAGNANPTAPDGDIEGTADYNYSGDVSIKGVEATLAGRPIPQWDFSVSAAYTKARYDNARLPCNDADGDGQPDPAGSSLPPAITGPGNVSYCVFNSRPTNTPDFSLSANTELRFAVGTLEPFVRALVNYRPGLTTASNYRYRSREIVNLYVGLRGDEAAWELTAFAKNVLNQSRITSDSELEVTQPTSSFFGPPNSYNSGYRTISSTTPREFGLTGIFRF